MSPKKTPVCPISTSFFKGPLLLLLLIAASSPLTIASLLSTVTRVQTSTHARSSSWTNQAIFKLMLMGATREAQEGRVWLNEVHLISYKTQGAFDEQMRLCIWWTGRGWTETDKVFLIGDNVLIHMCQDTIIDVNILSTSTFQKGNPTVLCCTIY